MNNDPASTSRPSSAASTAIGRCAVALSLVSLIAYYATSLGIRNVVAFGFASAHKVMQTLGHGR